VSRVSSSRRTGATSIVLGLAVLMLAPAWSAGASLPLTNGRRVVSRTGGTPSRNRTVIRFSRDPNLVDVGDPACPASSSIRIVAGGYDSGVLPLSCSGWRRASTGLRFEAPDGPGGLRKLSVGGGTLSATFAGALHAPIPSSAPFVEIALRLGTTEHCGRLLALAANGTTTFRAVGPSTACSVIAPRPSFLVVNLDDTRADGVDRMPVLQERLAAEGQTFRNAFTPNALCCPSRASLLTGLLALHHGTVRHSGPQGGAQSFRELGSDAETIAVWLQRAGYRTGLFGKYLNGYGAATEGGIGPNGGLYVPPGWDRWWAMLSPEFFGGVHGLTYEVSTEDGSLLRFDDHTSDAEYSTDLSAAELRQFVLDATAAGRPFFAYWTPVASHTDGFEPPAPAARHFDFFADLPLWRPPSWDEADLSDKPRWLRELVLDPNGVTDELRRRAYESLLAVDEQLGSFLDLFASLGIDDDTMVVFTSDNGAGWGEHGLFSQQKMCPYEECQRVPFVVRYPRAGGGGVTRDEPVLNVDVAPTLAALAGAGMPAESDGRSILPLLAGAPEGWRTDYLLESWRQSCRDTLAFTAPPVDGDRIRLFYGDPWTVAPRASILFEFDLDGVVGPDAVRVPINPALGWTVFALSQALTTRVPEVRLVSNPFGRVIAEDATAACHGPLWWEEVDQTGVIDPSDPLPAYFGVRDVARGYTWVEYESGERELYDLNLDPFQLDSRHDDPAYAELRAELAARTATLRQQ